MANYSTPGVYLEDIKSAVVMPTGVNSSAAFAGVAHSGPVGIPTEITSWNAFLKIYGAGIDSVFSRDSYLAYAVYGFFQNGGSKCYVLRVTNGTVASGGVTYSALKAKPTTDEEHQDTVAYKLGKALSAKYEGEWGNNLKVVVPKDGVNVSSGTFALKVLLNNTVVESWNNLGATAGVAGCYGDIINSESDYITVTDLTVDITLASIVSGDADIQEVFAGGTEGLTANTPVANTVYETALLQFDAFDSIGFVAVPGADSALQKIVADYCTNTKYRIAICDGSIASTNSELVTLRNLLGGTNAGLYAPWCKVSDPLSSAGNLISVPICGHIAGVWARITQSRGFWKAPAGTEANVRGVVDVARIITNGEMEDLSPKGINCIIPKTNYGIVVWGARSCNSDLVYNSDLYTNITIKKNVYDISQPFVFEQNNSKLWTKVSTTIQSYLQSLFEQGAFAGDTPEQSYYVKCDEELNPESVRNQGKLVCEVGYATSKPAEFVVFRIAHELTTTA